MKKLPHPGARSLKDSAYAERIWDSIFDLKVVLVTPSRPLPYPPILPLLDFSFFLPSLTLPF